MTQIVTWQLAQLNIATLSAPIDSPQLVDFVSALNEINALAEASNGFVWRLVADDDNALDIHHPFNDNVIVNMSVWESIECLHAYVYRSAHVKIMARRKEWFDHMPEAYTVLWWVPQVHRPTPAEAHRKLEILKEQGPTAEAFTFKNAFSPPNTV